MSRLTKYEKETIILTSEGDNTASIYTFNMGLKHRLAAYSDEWRASARAYAKEHGFRTVQDGNKTA